RPVGRSRATGRTRPTGRATRRCRGTPPSRLVLVVPGGGVVRPRRVPAAQHLADGRRPVRGWGGFRRGGGDPGPVAEGDRGERAEHPVLVDGFDDRHVRVLPYLILPGPQPGGSRRPDPGLPRRPRQRETSPPRSAYPTPAA